MSNFKVGDIVRFDRADLHGLSRGVITKIETIDRPGSPLTYAAVFWFELRVRRAVNTVWLIKLEVRGE